VARRRVVELPPGVEPFDRSPEQWRELGAPAWVFVPDAAAEAYSAWALPGYGRGMDPADPVMRRYYVQTWMARCTKTQFLAHVGALSPAEVALLGTGSRAGWGDPARCWARMLDADADVPAWLECCRRERPRHGPS
jgi:hypothetical protein